jgi:hypothetical protein
MAEKGHSLIGGPAITDELDPSFDLRAFSSCLTMGSWKAFSRPRAWKLDDSGILEVTA